jgi:large subunit ribosomal protein L22
MAKTKTSQKEKKPVIPLKRPRRQPEKEGGRGQPAPEKEAVAASSLGEAMAAGKYLKISPTKVRGILDLVRGETVKEARRILRFSPKKGAQICLKVLDSAVANAGKERGFDEETWIVADIRADKGPIFRRKLDYKARFGRGIIVTPSTHLTVTIRKKSKEGKDGS